MGLDVLIAKIKKRAHELHTDGTSLECAYHTAVSDVFMEIAEQRVTPFQERILRTLQILSPRAESPPVRTRQLLGAVGSLDTRWQAWYHLKALEEAGLVERPNGKKSGWKARKGV